MQHSEEVRPSGDASPIERMFATDEVRREPMLQWLHWALLFGCFLSFTEWMREPHVSRSTVEAGRHLCLPWFQQCGSLYFFDHLPHSFSQRLFYAGLFSLIAASALFAFRKDWARAQLTMLPLFIWKALMTAVLTARTGCDFEYFHLPLMLVYLVGRHKLYFARRLFMLVYFLAATVKFHESWVVGTYFTSTGLGLPLIPDVIAPWITNFIIAAEIIGPWLHFHKSSRVRRLNLWFWVAFHAYSIVLVGHKYPFFCLPVLVVLFGPDVELRRPPLSGRALVGWLIAVWLLVLQGSSWLIEGDIKHTLEGMKLGVGMFDANHQCEWTVTTHLTDGTSREQTRSSREGMARCDVYKVWFRHKQRCEKRNVQAIGLRYAHSINGHPFYLSVDTDNLCGLEYRPLQHNAWIRDPEHGAPEVGYPRPNYTRSDEYRSLEGSIIFEEPSIELNGMQRAFKSVGSALIGMWMVAWLLVLLLLITDVLAGGRLLSTYVSRDARDKATAA